jgi:voltage-gated potassium channel
MTFSETLIRVAYWLQASARYAGLKGFFHRLLVDPRSRRRAILDGVMIVLVLTSVFLLIYDVRHQPGPWADAFEIFVVTVFIIEYLLRMWLYSDSHRILIEHWERAELVGMRFRLASALWAVVRRKLAYMATPVAIIDLLAILPGYRPLRFLRIFLLFRLLKLFRYARNLSAFGQVLLEKRFELYTLSIFVGSVVLVAAVAMYLFEAEQPQPRVTSLMDALYWSVITITTVGYGDIVPQTTEGRVVAMVLVFAGIAVISFATSIIVMAFHEKMGELRDNRVFSNVERLSGVTIVCGFGRIGQVVAQRLAAGRDPFVVVDRSPEAVALAHRHGYLAVAGDATDNTLLANLGLGRQATRILCLTHDDVSNVYITLTARQASPSILIISRANKAETVRKLTQAGANRVVRPYEVVGHMAAEFIGQPVAFDALYDVMTRAKGIHLEPVRIASGSWLDARPVSDIDFTGQHLILFGVIRPHTSPDATGEIGYELSNAHFYFNPQPAFRLHAHDILMLIGHEASLSRFKERFGQRRSSGMRGKQHR